MKVLYYIFRKITAPIVANLDLVLIWIVLLSAQPMISTESMLSNTHLAPWMMLSLGICAGFRACPLGDGPHPMLTARKNKADKRYRFIATVLIPVVLLYWYLAGRADLFGQETQGFIYAGIGFGILCIAAFFLMLARKHQVTAWNPPGLSAGLMWVAGPVCALLLAAVAGWFDIQEWNSEFASGVGLSLLIGVGFVSISLMLGRVRNLRQRMAAGQRNGQPYFPGLFRLILAFMGPAVGLYLLQQIYLILFHELFDFNQSFVIALHVVGWTAVIWQKPVPIAVYCMLHEVIPHGGIDGKGDTALSFEEAPEGSLRINPLKLRKTRAVHLWKVPVQAARIEDLDDPVRMLWSRPSAPLSSHVMGEACFEPDPITKKPQTEEITIRIRGGSDVSSVGQGDAQTRRLVVLRAFPVPGTSSERHLTTYRWDKRIPQQCIQIMDATTDRISLRSGDLIVLSTEGVARAYEVECGAPVYYYPEMATFRQPQIEDYVKA
jgi:hypothetical protein